MAKLFSIRIELLDIEPLIWRRVLIADDMPMFQVGAALVGAMGWGGYHLMAFEIDGKRYDVRFEGGLDLDDSLDMENFLARDLFKPGVEAALQYDFGDDWWHELIIEEHRDMEKGEKPPQCVDGANATPPEDSGGPFAFAETLEIANDPEHPDHEEFAGWFEDYDPKVFDLKQANRNIKKVIKAWS